MQLEKNNSEKWRGYRYSSIFSRSAIDSIVKRDDYSILQAVIRDYDICNVESKIQTYSDFSHYVYRYLTKHYRNEYVFKNSLISMLIKQFKTRETAIFNEFKVGNSIADLVLFNGISRAYEIKTALDTDKRLVTQMADYKRVFQQRYIVTEEHCLSKYLNADPDAGLVLLLENKGNIKYEIIKEAKTNYFIDPHLVIRCLRTYEYREMVRRFYGELPQMNALNSFGICEELIARIPNDTLMVLFSELMKERESNLGFLHKCDKDFRQICLCLHMSEEEYGGLKKKLIVPIKV